MLKTEQEIINVIQTCTVVINGRSMPLSELSQRDIKSYYKSLSFKDLKGSDFKSKIKFNHLFPNLTKESWTNVYCLPFNITPDNKIIEFQY